MFTWAAHLEAMTWCKASLHDVAQRYNPLVWKGAISFAIVMVPLLPLTVRIQSLYLIGELASHAKVYLGHSVLATQQKNLSTL